MQKITYKVQGLDCGNEVALLKGALLNYPGINKLDFNLMKGEMTVHYDGDQLDSGKILSLISSTGMQARLAHEGIEEHQRNFWGSHGRFILSIFSGIFILLGFIFHYHAHPNLLHILGIEQTPELLPKSAIFFYVAAMISASWHILPKALRGIRFRKLDIHLLMLIAAIGAIAIDQWFEGATVTFLFSIAQLLEHWIVERARRAISTLLDLSPKLACVITNNEGHLAEKKIEDIAIGERILVRPGEKFPLDGIILQGTSSVNQAPITGESMPIVKNPGDAVFAGTINEEGALECVVTKKSKDTTLHRIIEMVEKARGKRAKTEQWVETFSHYYTPLMLLLALLISVSFPLFLNMSWEHAIYQGLVLLVIACPCALVISTPVSIVSGLTSAARNGLLIKGGIYLEISGKIEALALDKTGTLTQGHPVVQIVTPLNGHTEKELLEIAGALERSSEHPLARAIIKKAHAMQLRLEKVDHFQIFKGMGAEGKIRGKPYWIGSHRLLHKKVSETQEVHNLALTLEDAGHSVVAVGDSKEVWGLISISDAPKPFVKETLAAIKALGLQKIVMLTGDNYPTARALANELDIDEVFAELLPEDKLNTVEELSKKHSVVAMVGDGVNDAPAMAASHLGIAMGAMGTDAAFETADIALMTDDLSLIPRLIRKSRHTLKVIKQNIGFALAIKVIFLLLALFGMTTLWMAIAADTGASLLVVFNALRLLKN